MTIRLGFLVVMSKLNEDIIARLDLGEHLVPSSLVDETLRGAAVDGVVVNNDVIVEILLEHHAPTAFLLATGGVLVGHGGVAYHEHGEIVFFVERHA